MVEVKANKNRVWRKLLAFVCAAGLAFLLYQLFYYPIFDTVASIGYQPSAEMSTVIDNIELTDNGMRILRASRPELQDATAFSQNCPNVSTETSTLGCYYARHIYVFDVDNAELNGIKEAVLAHELLHAVWSAATILPNSSLTSYCSRPMSRIKPSCPNIWIATKAPNLLMNCIR